ncbi:hypothetical protein [Aliterella atlantica]|uniref:Uncharacterized protein n=1 Tax=Aliterella atlantica CENA595 TaxID=1618023 RepID=A0A0D8ZKZ0_9CYAN|nr:hypothetical protein [Aliterella atlantica]KJH69400.1 hypothetical protein UH38_24155 [Aliterella atlantica CENA595]
MPSWDLTTRENWELLTSERRSVVYKNNTTPSDLNYKYTPIPPIYVTATTHTLLVGIVSNSARVHWFLGARVSQYLYVSPSSAMGLISGVQAADSKRAGLSRLTLIEFKNYNVIPYVVEVAVPYWLEDVYVEVWQYNGQVLTGEQPNLSELLDRLEVMAQQLASLEQHGI